MNTCGEGVGWGGGVSGMSGRYRLCGASAAADGWVAGRARTGPCLMPMACRTPAAPPPHPDPPLPKPTAPTECTRWRWAALRSTRTSRAWTQAVFAAAPREAMAGLLQVGARLVRPWACRDFSRAHAAGWHSWRSWPMPRRPCPPPLPQYCKERYGGMRQYMEYCGFSRQQQDSLRRCLTDGDW